MTAPPPRGPFIKGSGQRRGGAPDPREAPTAVNVNDDGEGKGGRGEICAPRRRSRLAIWRTDGNQLRWNPWKMLWRERSGLLSFHISFQPLVVVVLLVVVVDIPAGATPSERLWCDT